tara:strand:- start:1038 stop:1838 length:801 start_codon:yes stop_codon:yes gene_type:complete
MRRFEAPRLEWPPRTAGLVALASFLIPWGILAGFMWVRRQIEPGEEGLVMWWPFTGQQFAAIAFIGLALPVFLGLAVLLRRGAPWWPVVRWPWLIAAVFTVALAAQALNSRVMVYSDRIVTTGDGGSLRPGILRFDSANWVEVHCDLIRRKRQPYVATLAYAVHFDDGQVASLDLAHDRTRQGALRWFSAVEKLDRTVLATVPHRPASPTRSVECVRALRDQLGETNFTAARRMLGISDTDFARRYAEPHEAFQPRHKAGGEGTVE